MTAVTIVPGDTFISVDGAPLVFDFPAPQNLHALQWDGQQGHIEWEDDYNWPLSTDDATAYEDEVAPYVALWQAEKERIDQEAAARATEEAEAEAARLAEYNSAAARAIRLRTERDARLAATDKYLLADYPISTEELGNIRTYRQALRDLPAQEGAPFDGGGDETPWPAIPQL
ncbi:MAG: tail fiber assembly protein [Desulfovibrio sp.]|uniref:tail fiber assembly protein n=1 Tax=Desulfovibrio sp. TaxID=885 RepID=UPI002A370604|nr:tail fiber assembly protein [Desulfovibrio sp.]MDY0259348.1 tail fiber assembly protein [Desulfovibrio sp.]